MTKDLGAFNLVGPTRKNLVLDPLAVQLLNSLLQSVYQFDFLAFVYLLQFSFFFPFVSFLFSFPLNFFFGVLCFVFLLFLFIFFFFLFFVFHSFSVLSVLSRTRFQVKFLFRFFTLCLFPFQLGRY